MRVRAPPRRAQRVGRPAAGRGGACPLPLRAPPRAGAACRRDPAPGTLQSQLARAPLARPSPRRCGRVAHSRQQQRQRQHL
eukprot:3878816-Alexandrium_andersonii.AAC.1